MTPHSTRTGFLILIALLLPGCGLLPSQVPASSEAGDEAPVFDPELFFCGLTDCTVELVRCMFDNDCREALLCHARCGSRGARREQQACHLTCQLGQGNQSPIYTALIQCFADNGCLPTLQEGTDGRCLVTSENIDQVLVLDDLADIEGTWLEVRGRNCGVADSDWEGGYDALPCRASSWVFQADQWWYHTSFCAPTDDGSCGGGEPVFLIAEPSLSSEQPGLLEVPYTNPPLQPQEEEWYVLSRPHPDWVMYTYCGSTPVGAYGGVNIMTRDPQASTSAMPAEVEAEFRFVADAFGFSYDDMCDTEHTLCSEVTAEADVTAWRADP